MDSEILKMRCNHLGQIGFRVALFGFIVALSLILSSIFSMIIVAFVAIFGFVLPLITFFMPLAFNPNYFDDLSKLINDIGSVTEFFWSLSTYIQFIAIASIIGSVVGSIFLLWDKNNRHWGKFVFCIISAILCLILVVLIASGTFTSGTIS